MAESRDGVDDGVPEYAECLDSFERFLAANGHTGRVTWTFLDDYAFHRRERRLAVSLRDPELDAKLVERLHAASVRGRGLLLALVGPVDDGRLLCTAWVPTSDDEAQDAMISGLKLSVRLTPPPIVVVSPRKLAALQARAEAISFTRDVVGWVHTRDEARGIGASSRPSADPEALVGEQDT